MRSLACLLLLLISGCTQYKEPVPVSANPYVYSKIEDKAQEQKFPRPVRYGVVQHKERRIATQQFMNGMQRDYYIWRIQIKDNNNWLRWIDVTEDAFNNINPLDHFIQLQHEDEHLSYAIYDEKTKEMRFNE